MPIKPEKKKLYPKDWDVIRRRILDRAGHMCEGSPKYPDCRAENGEPHPVTGSKVVLTIAHLDHNPENNELRNLRAWCQRCHNTYDAPFRHLNRKITRLTKKLRSVGSTLADQRHELEAKDKTINELNIKLALRDKADEQLGWDLADYINEYLFNNAEAAQALRLLVDPNHEEFMKRYHEDLSKREEVPS